MEINDRLTQELNDATARLKRLAQDIAEEETGGGVAGSETVTDVVDAAQGAADRDMHFATRSLLQARAKRLAAALGRLASGRYGICDECGEAIAPRRLAALPEVTSCLPCQVRRERTAHRHQDHHAAPEPHEHRSHHGGRGAHRHRSSPVSA
jgi:DnaK suppressor protein